MFSKIFQKVFILAVLLLSVSPVYAATYYVKWDATGAGNGTSWGDAYTTIQSAITANTATGHVFEVSGGADGHTYSELISTGAVTSGTVTIRGSTQAGHNGWVKINGSGGSTGQHTFTAARNTVLENLELTGAPSTGYNLLNNGKTVTATNVYITNGDRGVYNNGTLHLTNFKISGITGSWLVNNPLVTNTANLTYGIIEGNYAGLSTQKGTFNIKNVLIEGTDLNAVEIAGNNSQTVTLRNTIVGSGGHGNKNIHNVINSSTNAVVTASHNLLLGNGQNANTYNISNVTSTNSLFESPKFISNRRTSRIALVFHADGENLWKTIADYGKDNGIYALYYRNELHTMTSGEWASFLEYQNKGHGIGILSRNHSSLTNMNAITVLGPAGSTMDITVDESPANSSGWTGTVTLNESGQPAKYTINLSRSTASYDTLAELVDEINTKSGWTATVIDTGNGSGLGNKRRGIYSTALATVTGVNTASQYTALLNRDRFYFTELVEEKALAESNGMTVNTHNAPGGANDSSLRNWISTDTHGYFTKAGTTPFLGSFRSDTAGSYTLTSDEVSGDPSLAGFQVYNAAWEVISSYIGTTNIKRNTATLLDWMGYVGGSIVVLGHDIDDFSEANWKQFVDLLVENEITAPNLEDTVQYIRSGTDVDANGQRWTRTLTDQANYRLKYTSPAIDSGTDLSLTTDIEGNPIYGTPDMGPYEYQPPYTIGTHEVNVSAPIRIYSDGKYRYTEATSGSITADFSVTPVGGFGVGNYSHWADVDIDSWQTSGNKNKSFNISSPTSGLTTTHTIGDLLPLKQYTVTANDVVINTQTTNGSGQLSFSYTDGYSSTVSFEVERVLEVPEAPVLSSVVITNQNAVVHFTAPSEDGGASITGYTVTSTPAGLTASGSISPITVSGLNNGSLYNFIVKANNSVGISPASNQSSSVGFTLSGAVSVPTSINTSTNTIISNIPQQVEDIKSNTETIKPSTNPTIITSYLKKGMKSKQVFYLQEILAKDPVIYPEGIVSGFYGPLTQKAVKLFQVKYKIAKAGEPGYGSVGPKTRAKLVQLQNM